MIPGSANPLLLASAAGAGGYEIERSLRFNSSDSAFLSRTPSSTGNRKTWTWAGWVKRTVIGETQALFGNYTDGSNFSAIRISNDYVQFVNTGSGGTNPNVTTPNLLRDPSAWYHIVFALDTTQATSSNRVRVYINGVQLTTSGTYPDQNADLRVNTASLQQNLGAFDNSGGTGLNGYLADIHFIDGQALDPTSFGELDTNGVWQPIAYSGSYGTNGFHLDFADNSSAAALGYDAAGSNDWTVNNLSVAAGAGNDSLRDSPTNGSQTDTGVGGEVVGNYATWNPLDNNTRSTGGNGNLEAVITGADALYGNIRATHGIGQKTYWETVVAGTSRTYQYHGIAPSDSALVASGSGGIGYGNVANSVGVYCQDGTVYVNGSSVLTQSLSIATNDVLMHAYDPTSGKYWAGRNGSWFNSGNPAAGTGQVTTLSTSKQWMPAVSSASTQNITANFGQRPFAYTAPSGFKALCTTNLPEPTIANPSTVMDVKLYTGNGSTQTISGLGFSPDLVWIKERSSTSSHQLYDTIRGATNTLYSNSSNEEQVNANALTSFTSTGFNVGVDNNVNQSAQTYAAWAWDAGSSTVSNDAGSITSQVRANASAGFSIVTYTGTGGTGTVGHGLGVAPSMIIVKNRSNAVNWAVAHAGIDSNRCLNLNGDIDASTVGFLGLDKSSFTSTTFTVNYSDTNTTVVNGSSNNYVAYCFAPVAGYSAFGSYTGNGSTDGPFVYTGFRPRWVLIKGIDGGDHWYLYDSARLGYNPRNEQLTVNLSDAEYDAVSYPNIDICANGFKTRTTNAGRNASGVNYLYIAFAESPFSYSRAR